MRTFTATDAKQRLAVLLDTAQREPVAIQRHERDVAVLVSAVEYARMRDLRTAEFQRFCDRVARDAEDRGMNEQTLDTLLHDGE